MVSQDLKRLSDVAFAVERALESSDHWPVGTLVDISRSKYFNGDVYAALIRKDEDGDWVVYLIKAGDDPAPDSITVDSAEHDLDFLMAEEVLQRSSSLVRSRACLEILTHLNATGRGFDSLPGPSTVAA